MTLSKVCACGRDVPYCPMTTAPWPCAHVSNVGLPCFIFTPWLSREYYGQHYDGVREDNLNEMEV